MMNKGLFGKLIIALSLILCCGAYAEDTISSYPQQGVLTFKGLDDTSSPLIIQDGRASDLQNVILSSSLTLQKRHGYNIVGKPLNHLVGSEQFPAITGLYYTKLSSGTEYIYSICGNNLYYLNSGVWTRIVSVPLLTYNKNNQFQFITALDTTIFTNNVDTIKKITNGTVGGTLSFTSLTSTSRPTKAKCLAWFKNYLVVGNTTENSTAYTTRIRWSNVGTIETWSDDDYIDIAELGGQEINAFAQLNDDLYIFLTDSIWKASLVGGTETYNLAKVIDGIGCIARNSVQIVNLYGQGKGIMFLSKDKRVYFYNGASIIELSQLIHETMDGLSATRLQYSVSAATPADYFLCTSLDSSASNDILLHFNTEIGEWTKHIQIDANAMAYVVDSDSIPQVYFGNYDSINYQWNDSSLDSDVAGGVGGISSLYNSFVLPDLTATGLQMLLLDDVVSYTATGATITLTSGTGANQERVVVYSTATGVVVDSAFTTTPDSTTLFSIGSIDAYYKTKWFDFGVPARLKLMGELYFWADTSSGVDIDVNYATDFGADLGATAVLLSSSGGAWGTAVWGTSLWGGEQAMFKKCKLKGQARYARFSFQNDDIDENFNIYGYIINHWYEDVF